MGTGLSRPDGSPINFGDADDARRLAARCAAAVLALRPLSADAERGAWPAKQSIMNGDKMATSVSGVRGKAEERLAPQIGARLPCSCHARQHGARQVRKPTPLAPMATTYQIWQPRLPSMAVAPAKDGNAGPNVREVATARREVGVVTAMLTAM